MHTPAPRPAPDGRLNARLLGRGAGVLLARARFLVLVGATLAVIAWWPTLRAHWDKLTGPAVEPGGLSSDIEYWCPMCPGVVSDWPTKCPVCSMTLVRRTKGEMTPLPDGVLARVQLSPYRVQLAGLITADVGYRRLEQTVTVAGLLEAAPSDGRLSLAGDVSGRDAALLAVDQPVEVACDSHPGETFTARVSGWGQPVPGLRAVRVRIEVDGRGLLRPGLFASATCRTPVARSGPHPRLAVERWRDQAALQLAVTALAGPDGPAPEGPFDTLLDAAARQLLWRNGFALAVPESAVIDTGTRSVVYVERMRGTFDALEVRLGRRCGEFYPVLAGLSPGDRVVAVGAVLLDAETRLNPSVAAAYFGAGGESKKSATSAGPAPPGVLSPEDQLLARKQRICPVTKAPLDSMGGPVKVVLNGRTVFVCCDGCEESLRAYPAEFLPRLPR